jgi:hypothetical protein
MIVVDLALIQIKIRNADIVGSLIVVTFDNEKENSKTCSQSVEKGCVSVEFQIPEIKLLGRHPSLDPDEEKLISIGIPRYPEEQEHSQR